MPNNFAAIKRSAIPTEVTIDEQGERSRHGVPGEVRLQEKLQAVADPRDRRRSRADLEEKQRDRSGFAVMRSPIQEQKEHDGVDGDAQRTRERQADMLLAPHQEPIHGKIRKGEHGADDGGSECVSRGIESARQDVLRAPGEHAQRKKHERGGGGVEIRSAQSRVRKDQINDRRAFRDGERRNRH